MDIILYLFQTTQDLYRQNCWLINFICRYIPLKQRAFDGHIPQKNTRSSKLMNSLSLLTFGWTGLTKLLENFKFIADGLTDDPDPAEKGQIRPFSAIQRGRVRAEP